MADVSPFPSNGEVVVRVVYDGPPRAGKTTSLRALAENLRRPVESPGEAEGRTLLFDWMEYVGGRFEGRSIRCQVIAVPGQQTLDARRRALLALADVVVLVADTTALGLSELALHLRRLRSDLEALGGGPVGILVQANKRDLTDAVSLEEVHRTLDGTDLAIEETVATSGAGIRTSFLHALRLGLDRVRTGLEHTGVLETGPVIRGSEDLLARLRQADHGLTGKGHEVSDDARADLRQTLVDELAEPEGPETPDGNPRAPHPESNGTLLWPPVRARLHLLGAWSAGPLTAETSDDGSWRSEGALGWSARSHTLDRYPDLDAARAALERWAEVHALARAALSPERSLGVAAGGTDGWRLWQMVRRDPSLRELILDAVAQGSPNEVADRLWSSAQALISARVELLKGSLRVPCQLETCGVARSRCVYLGWVPSIEEPAAPPAEVEDRRTFLRHRFGDVMTEIVAGAGPSVGRILDRLEERSRRAPSRSWVAEALAALLIEP